MIENKSIVFLPINRKRSITDFWLESLTSTMEYYRYLEIDFSDFVYVFSDRITFVHSVTRVRKTASRASDETYQEANMQWGRSFASPLVQICIPSLRDSSSISCRVVIISCWNCWNAGHSKRVCLASLSRHLLSRLAHLGLSTNFMRKTLQMIRIPKNFVIIVSQ